LTRRKQRLEFRSSKVVLKNHVVQHRDQVAALAMKHLGSDGDQHATRLHRGVEELVQRIAPAIEVEQAASSAIVGRSGSHAARIPWWTRYTAAALAVHE
jgi:hypothetical protein